MPRIGLGAKRRFLVIVGALALIAVLAGCADQGGHTSTTPTASGSAAAPATSSDIHRVVLSVLDNIKQNGFDAAANGGQGGLWIDWQYGTNPLITNGGKQKSPPGHDRLTDLRYLHDLLWYTHENPNDTQFQGEIQRYTPIVKAEFSACTDVRGWIFDQWFDMYAFSKDTFYRQCANTIANYYFTQWYHAASGALYQTSNTYPNGMYRTEDAIGMGSALIEAGTYFNRSDWTQAGRAALAYLKTHAYLPQYHVYLHLLGDVTMADGSANPNPTILKIGTVDSSGGDTSSSDNAPEPRDGGNVKAGSIGSEAFAFLRAYQAVHDQQYLNEATDLLSALSPASNVLGLWDPTNLGYYYGVGFAGTDYQHPGTPSPKQHKKEAGRQLNILRAAHLANVLTNGAEKDLEAAMLNIAINKAYYAPGHGYLYSTLETWQPHTRKGQVKNFVTTEAMGIAIEALLSISAEPPVW